MPVKKKNRESYPAAKAIPESEIVKLVAHYFDLDPNVEIFRRNVGAMKTKDRFIRFGQAGESDFWGIIKEQTCPACGCAARSGVHLEIECKRYGGKLTASQFHWLDKMRKMGAVTLVAIPRPSQDDPTGLQWLRRELGKITSDLCQQCQSEMLENILTESEGEE